MTSSHSIASVRARDAARRRQAFKAAATLGTLVGAALLAACGGGDSPIAETMKQPLAAKADGAAGPAATLTAREALGKAIFFDARLSLNGNQSCATCHGAAAGWTGPDAAINAGGAVYEASVPGLFGNRKPPSTAYATPSPILHFSLDRSGAAVFAGGNFWDGRATGERLGSPAAEQALGPFLNPLEQALPGAAEVVGLICSGPYAAEFVAVAGAQACDPANVGPAYDQVGFAVAAYEASPESNAFTSKYDYAQRGLAQLTPQEKLGLAMFKGKAKCAACHTLDGPQGGAPLFTDFTYDNLGLPRNPDNPFYAAGPYNPQGIDWVDLGLGGFLASRLDYAPFAAANDGRHKVPTLRNVDKRPSEGFVKAYGHNGYFKSLKSLVHFYNTRDVKPRCASAFTREAEALLAGCWPAPEVDRNVNLREIGNLHLTSAQEDALVAFMKTLSDGYTP